MQKRIIFYEVNPLYYKDTNNDGIGDLNGMTNQADYFKYLGVNAIIIPNLLSMYSKTKHSLSSYRNILPKIGNMDDFKQFSRKMKKLNIKIIIDINIGTINESHEWFKIAQASKEDFEKLIARPYVDENTTQIKNDSKKTSDENLVINEKTSSYYFVNEKTSNILLNWKDGVIQKMFLDVVRFWHKLGVGGFRFSNFEYVGQAKPEKKLDKDVTLIILRRFYRSLKEINENFIIIGKSSIINADEAKILLNPTTKVIDYLQPLNYSLVGLDKKHGNDLIGKFNQKDLVNKIKSFYNGTQTILSFGSPLTGRPISRWGGSGQFHIEASKSLAILQMFLSSSPSIYYGEEIGTKNIGLTYLDDFQDTTLYERKRKLEAENISMDNFMAAQVLQNPINSHSLMAWTNKKNGGFSNSEKTIVPVSNSYHEINVFKQFNDENSILEFYRSLIKFISNMEIKEILSEGDSEIKIQKFGTGVIQITNSYRNKTLIALINLSNKVKKVNIPQHAKLILSTYASKDYRDPIQQLQGYESVVYAREILTNIEFVKTEVKDNSLKKKKVYKEITKNIMLDNNNEKKVMSTKTISKSPIQNSNPILKKNNSELLGKWKLPETDNNKKNINLFSLKQEKNNMEKTQNNILDSQKNINQYKNKNEVIDNTMHNETSNNGEKNLNVNLEGTIEMITNDIESTQEMNFDDNLLTKSSDLDSNDKKNQTNNLDDYNEDTNNTRMAAHTINREVDNEVNDKTQLLEQERLYSTDPHFDHAETLNENYNFSDIDIDEDEENNDDSY